MAKAQQNLGDDLDSLDLDGGLDGLNLEDDKLFADLDNEFKMDDLSGGAASDGGLDLDLGGEGGDGLDDLMGSGKAAGDGLDDLMSLEDNSGADGLDDLMAEGSGDAGDGLELDLGGVEAEPSMSDFVDVDIADENADATDGGFDGLDSLPEETPDGTAEELSADSLDLGGEDSGLGDLDSLADEAIDAAGAADLSLDELDSGLGGHGGLGLDGAEADTLDLGDLPGEGADEASADLDLGALEPETAELSLGDDALDLSTMPTRSDPLADEPELDADAPLDLDEVPMEPPSGDIGLDLSEGGDLQGNGNLIGAGDELELPDSHGAEAESVALEGFEALDDDMDQNAGMVAAMDSIQFDTLDELGEEPAAPGQAGEFFAVPDVDLNDVSLDDLVAGNAAAMASETAPAAAARAPAATPAPAATAAPVATAAPAATAAPRAKTAQPGRGPAQTARQAESDILELSPAQAASAPPAARSPLGLERELLLSVPRKVNVEMGSVDLSGSEIMELSYGSIVQLKQTVGEPVELVLEGRTIARGEIVVINGRSLGVRILQLQK